MVSVPPYSSTSFGTSGFRNGLTNLFSNYSENTTVNQKQEKEITIYTEEGDRVTLSTLQQNQAVYTRNEAMGYAQRLTANQDAEVSVEQLVTQESESFKLADSRTMTLSIEGDLSDDELADIKKALSQIDRIMMQQLRGQDVLTGVDRAETLLDLETIAGIEADYSSETVAYTQQTASMEQHSVFDGGLTPENRFNHPIDRMADILKSSRVDPPKFITPLQQLFANISQTCSDQIESDSCDAEKLLDVINQFQEQLLVRISS